MNDNSKGWRWPMGMGLALAACLSLWTGLSAAWAGPEALEVRRLGVSRVGDTSLLTVVLNKPGEARVTPRTEGSRAMLVVDFPQAKGMRLPARQAGDDILVRTVQTEATAAGVRITLEIAPNRSYTYWRRSKPLGSGQTVYVVGLKAEGGAPPPSQAQMLPPVAPPPEPERPPQQLAQSREEYPAVGSVPATGRLADLKRLMPRAQALWQLLENTGWNVSQAQDYDRPGQRYTKGFVLTNSQYPEMVVKVAFLPATTPGAPNIGMVTLSMDNLRGDTADKYRRMRQMSFAQIKQNYEDIGDFFDDGMKPLRVDLRKQCQNLANRYASFLQQYVQAASPGNPKAADKIMGHLKEKVNIRFEGVQYTVSEDPLVLLNLVDFLYIRSYYLSAGGG